MGGGRVKSGGSCVQKIGFFNGIGALLGKVGQNGPHSRMPPWSAHVPGVVRVAAPIRGELGPKNHLSSRTWESSPWES